MSAKILSFPEQHYREPDSGPGVIFAFGIALLFDVLVALLAVAVWRLW